MLAGMQTYHKWSETTGAQHHMAHHDSCNCFVMLVCAASAAPVEVFHILEYRYSSQQAAAAGCTTLGAVLATRAQMLTGYYLGANVCS